jgi:outer membrane lipoprotein-sorting protein
MKKKTTLLFAIATLSLLSFGCASQGTDPEKQSQEAAQERQAERQQAEFRKGLPPVNNPSQVR